MIQSANPANIPAPAPASQSGRFGIFPRVLLTMLLVSAVPMAGFFYISNVRAKAQLEADAVAKLTAVAQSLAGDVDSWVDGNVLLLRNVAEMPGFGSLPGDVQTDLLTTTARTHDWLADVSLTNAAGKVTAIADAASIRKGVPTPVQDDAGNFLWDVSTRAYFQQLEGGAAVGKQTVIDMMHGTAQMCLAVPVRPGGTFGGAAIGCSNVSSISSKVTAARVGETGYALMTDENAQLIAHGNADKLSETELVDYREHPVYASGTLGEPVVYEEGGERKVGVAQQTEFGWTLIVEQSYADAYATVLEAQRNALGLLAVTVLLVVVIALTLARRLAGPIQNLTEVADSMSRGELGVAVGGTGRRDEIGALARAVDRMGVSLKLAMGELEKRTGA